MSTAPRRPADGYFMAPIPRCPEHTHMHFDFPTDRWICHGWDGEGCPYTVTAEALDWTPLGTIGTDTLHIRGDLL
jgi:hypothetical protein